MRVEKKSKAFAYRIYSHLTQQCVFLSSYTIEKVVSNVWFGLGDSRAWNITLQNNALVTKADGFSLSEFLANNNIDR